MELEVRHLRILCTVADAGSLNRAAMTLGMAQPTLTRQLQRLERLLGGQLFVRDRTGVRPTGLGEYVLTRARAVLPTLAELQARPARRDRTRHRIRVGTMTDHLAGLLTGITMVCPQADVTAEHADRPDVLVDLVAAGHLDAALLRELPGCPTRPRADIDHCTFVTEPMFVLLPAAHRLANSPEVTLRDLAHERWIAAPPSDERWGAWFAAACAAAGFTPRTPYRLTGTASLALVRAGWAIALTSGVTPYGDRVVARPLAGAPLRVDNLIAVGRHSPLRSHLARLAAVSHAAHVAAVAANPTFAAWCTDHSPLDAATDIVPGSPPWHVA